MEVAGVGGSEGKWMETYYSGWGKVGGGGKSLNFEIGWRWRGKNGCRWGKVDGGEGKWVELGKSGWRLLKVGGDG